MGLLSGILLSLQSLQHHYEPLFHYHNLHPLRHTNNYSSLSMKGKIRSVQSWTSRVQTLTGRRRRYRYLSRGASSPSQSHYNHEHHTHRAASNPASVHPRVYTERSFDLCSSLYHSTHSPVHSRQVAWALLYHKIIRNARVKRGGTNLR